MKKTIFITGNHRLEVNDDGDFIDNFNKALQEYQPTKLFIVDDWGDGYVQTVDCEDPTNIWVWEPEMDKI